MIGIQPGVATTIGLTGRKVVKKPAPYSNCTETSSEAQLLLHSVPQNQINLSLYNVVRSPNQFPELAQNSGILMAFQLG